MQAGTEAVDWHKKAPRMRGPDHQRPAKAPALASTEAHFLMRCRPELLIFYAWAQLRRRRQAAKPSNDRPNTHKLPPDDLLTGFCAVAGN